MIRVRNPNELLVGTFLLLMAGIGFWMTSELRVGSANRMGPGYVPTSLCWLLVILGAVTAARGLLIKGEPAERWTVRPMVLISAGIAWFAFSVERFGLVAAILGLVLVGSLADPTSRRWEAVALSIGLAIFCVGVFVMALGLPIDLWPRGLR